MKHLSKRCCTY